MYHIYLHYIDLIIIVGSTFKKIGVNHQVSRTQFCSLIDILTTQMNNMEFEEFIDFLTTSVKVNNCIVSYRKCTWSVVEI